MGVIIMTDGRPFSEDRSQREALPLDTVLRCPTCNGQHVLARTAKTTQRIGGEDQQDIPRMQDRKCAGCGHEWTTVLPPLIYSNREWLARQPR